MKYKTPITDQLQAILNERYSEELADLLEDVRRLETSNADLEDDLIVLRRRSAMLRKMLAEATQ